MAIKSIEARCATSSTLKRQQIFFDDATGLITAVHDCLFPKEKIDFYFDDDCLLFAGMGDIHIHAREDLSGLNTYKEDFHSTCCAALNGGLAHVADMPNNPIAPIDDESYLKKLSLTKNLAIPILLYAGIGPKTRPLTFAVPYKVYMGPSIGELYFKNNEDLDNVLKYYQNEHISFHCEDPEILEQHVNEKNHFSRRPISAEIMATDLALWLIKKYHLKGKLCHYSAGAGLSAIKKAKDSGVMVTCEVTPQHLYFSEEDINEMPASEQVMFQMNPPIRSREDAQKLLAALKAGDIDYLATDHAPHSKEEKQKGMSGLPGLDTYVPFVSWLLIDQGFSAYCIAKICSENPGEFINGFLESMNQQSDIYKKWGRGLGFLRPDYSASFTIINLKRPITIQLDKIKSKAQWSPFLQKTFPGSLECLFIHGKKVQ